jgi:hypothetical protein
MVLFRCHSILMSWVHQSAPPIFWLFVYPQFFSFNHQGVRWICCCGTYQGVHNREIRVTEEMSQSNQMDYESHRAHEHRCKINTIGNLKTEEWLQTQKVVTKDPSADCHLVHSMVQMKATVFWLLVGVTFAGGSHNWEPWTSLHRANKRQSPLHSAFVGASKWWSWNWNDCLRWSLLAVCY